jgi:hypothetical protein
MLADAVAGPNASMHVDIQVCVLTGRTGSPGGGQAPFFFFLVNAIQMVCLAFLSVAFSRTSTQRRTHTCTGVVFTSYGVVVPGV